MSKINLKDLLKEAAWDHTSGKALPTLEDVQKAYQAKQGKINEEYVESMNSHELANLLGKI